MDLITQLLDIEDRVVGEISLVGEKITLSGAARAFQDVKVVEDGKAYWPKDGEPWIRNFPQLLRNVYLRAIIIEDDEIKHLPGQHSQQSHAGGRGRSVGKELADDEIVGWTKTSFKPISGRGSPYSDQEEMVMGVYKTVGALDLNQALRTGNLGGMNEAGLDLISGNLDSAIKKQRVPEDVSVYRTVKNSEDFNLWDLSEGDSFVDKAYVSTSLSRDFTEGILSGSSNVQMRISLKKGTNVLPLDRDKNYVAQGELLLGRNTEFRVTGKVEVDGQQYLDLEIVND